MCWCVLLGRNFAGNGVVTRERFFFFFSAWRVDWQGFLLADYNCFIRWIRGFVLFILVMI